ncbi:MAG TPA: PAS domain S-box protein, partial [Verrucomicrobiae bacterium]|nr:PAS domain S-box protein [Verrucomicrobiae bacterium]
MSKSINVLIVEDRGQDAELIVGELRRAGFDPQWTRVQTEADFLTELEKAPDIILSDYSMPQFNGLRAAELLRASRLNIPFILISGTVGEEVAVAAMRQGVTDYLLKDRLTRLGSAVEQALLASGLETERKQRETALQDEQVMLNSLVSSIPDLIYFKDRQSRFIRINDALARRFGLGQAAEAVGKTDFDFHGHEHAQQAYDDEQRVMQTGEDLVGREEKEAWPDGRLTWASSTKVPMRNLQGNITGLVGISRDITVAKKAELRFRRLVDSNAQGVIFWNTKGEITGGNDAFLKLVGCTREDLETGRINWVEMTPPEYAEHDQRALKELSATGVCGMYEKEWIRKDTVRVPILLGAAMFEDNPTEGVCFVHDLTGLKKLEGQFRQVQKMESFGQLAAGVAHDFNNILSVIQIQAALIKDDNRLSPEQMDCANQIEESTARAATLTRQLLLFSRKEITQLRDLDLNQSVNAMTNMLRRILGENIQVHFKFSLQPVGVNADAGMMDQVLMNLAVNARDAMSKGGKLTIETSAVNFDQA